MLRRRQKSDGFSGLRRGRIPRRLLRALARPQFARQAVRWYWKASRGSQDDIRWTGIRGRLRVSGRVAYLGEGTPAFRFLQGRTMDRRQPAAFLSYVRADDTNDDGNILGICRRLTGELRAMTGRPIDIFVDRKDIEWGENWSARINESLETATLLIPVLTPSYFVSKACRDELTKFLEREARLGRGDLVLPVYYITASILEDPVARESNSLAQELAKRQYVDWRDLRLKPLRSQIVRTNISDLAQRMIRAFERGSDGSQAADTESPVDGMGNAGADSKRFEGLDETPKLLDIKELLTEEHYIHRLRPGTAYLVTVYGPTSGHHLLDKDLMVIGRHPDSDIPLLEKTISRRHAEIVRTGNVFHVRDLGSRNGVVVNGDRVREHQLETGDRIEIGPYRLAFLITPGEVSLITSEQRGELTLDASYVWSTGGIMWALPGSLTSEDTPIVEVDDLVGNPHKQRKLETLLAERDGVKIGADSRGDERPHSELRLVANGEHERPVVIVGMQANIIKRERPLSGTLVFGPPEGAGENIEIGFDLDSRSQVAHSVDSEMVLGGSYFATHRVSLKRGEQAVFSIRAFTAKHFCEWELQVDTMIDGKPKAFVVKDGQRPFRTTAFADTYHTVYEFDFMASRFVRLPPGSKWARRPFPD
jgi:pSer/pThr/pTyr-binding forkhead associated (FHA) protein